jgi:hypothetical protein
MSLRPDDPEHRGRVWALMQRIERCRHRAHLAEVKTASGTADFRVEMAEIAQEWRDLAAQIEADGGASDAETPPRNAYAPPLGRVPAMRRWPMEFVLGLGIGALGALTLSAPRWIEATTGFDIDRGSGALEWAVAAIVSFAGVAAALAMRTHSKRQKDGR